MIKSAADRAYEKRGLEAEQRESLRQADHLFQTILHQAFTTGF
jgi:hypothetical protein